MEQHVKEVHTEHPNCPFCSVSFTNMKFLRKHIDDNNPDTSLRPAPTPATTTGVPATLGSATGASTTPLTTTDGEVSNTTPQEDYEVGENEGHRQEEESTREESQQVETGDWQQVGRQGGRFQCQVCGFTRNTKHQLEKHIHKRHEDNYDAQHESYGDCVINLSERRENCLII